MRKTIFRINETVWNYLENYKGGISNDTELIVGEIENKDEGLVCLNCGNRGDFRPIKIHGYRKINITVGEDGTLNFELDIGSLQKKTERIYEDDAFSIGRIGDATATFNSTQEMFTCMNCESPMVVPAEIALTACETKDCHGCPVCNNYQDYEEVIEECSSCVIAFEARKRKCDPCENINDITDEQCEGGMNCGTFFVRRYIYNVEMTDIFDMMIMEDLDD